MRAGIDIGTTLTKFAWKYEGEDHRISTAEMPLEEIVGLLKACGVREVCLTGNGESQADWSAEGFLVSRPSGDPLRNEFLVQADGARRILKEEGHDAEEFLLVSVGTGTSFTYVTKDDAQPFPFGTAVGGGFIMGLAHPDHDALDVDSMSISGEVRDLLLEDVVPNAAGLPGWAPVAHFGKMRSSPRNDPADPELYGDRYATAMHMVATLVLRDMALLSMIKGPAGPKHAFIVGSTVGGFIRLHGMFEDLIAKFRAFRLIPETVMPTWGEYAGAVGALYADVG